uniref:Resolvase HTH domain-containing protein n=1 Tax=Strigamia maritima TaxID=126957 RepID=T1JNL6_STRMM
MILLPEMSQRLVDEEQFSTEPTRIGRTPCRIFKHDISVLKDAGYTIEQISKVFNVSSSTIFRLMKKFGLRKKDMPQLTDTALDEVVRKCSQQFPHWGVVMQHGHFKSQGINVPLIRLYEANRRVDPEGLCFRLRKVLKRRVYNVPGPQKLWHLDGNEN